MAGLALEVQVQQRDLYQHVGKLPDSQQLFAQHRVDMVNDVVQADRVGQQLVVIFGVGQDGQYANLVNQPAECRLIGLELRVTAAQRIADAGDFQAFAPDIAHFFLDHVRTGVKNLLHDQANRQVAAVVDAQAGNGRVQVSDFLCGTKQRAVDDLDQSRRQRGVTADHLAQVTDTDFRIFSGLANLHGHFR
ncbi:hypothetical protein D3C73_978870 [compost metagenome]